MAEESGAWEVASCDFEVDEAILPLDWEGMVVNWGMRGELVVDLVELLGVKLRWGGSFGGGSAGELVSREAVVADWTFKTSKINKFLFDRSKVESALSSSWSDA